jgi:hypothetical protein
LAPDVETLHGRGQATVAGWPVDLFVAAGGRGPVSLVTGRVVALVEDRAALAAEQVRVTGGLTALVIGFARGMFAHGCSADNPVTLTNRRRLSGY